MTIQRQWRVVIKNEERRNEVDAVSRRPDLQSGVQQSKRKYQPTLDNTTERRDQLEKQGLEK